MPAFLIPVLEFLLSTAVGKFIVMTACYVIFSLFIPLILNLVAPFVGVGNINSMFSGLAGYHAFWINAFAVPEGLKLILSAYATRFLIRRLPVVG